MGSCRRSLLLRLFLLLLQEAVSGPERKLAAREGPIVGVAANEEVAGVGGGPGLLHEQRPVVWVQLALLLTSGAHLVKREALHTFGAGGAVQQEAEQLVAGGTRGDQQAFVVGIGVDGGVEHFHEPSASRLQREPGVAAWVARLQHCRFRFVVQGQSGPHPSCTHRHFHTQVEEPRVPVLHPVLPQQRIHHLSAGCFESYAQCLVFNIWTQASSVDFYCCLVGVCSRSRIRQRGIAGGPTAQGLWTEAGERSIGRQRYCIRSATIRGKLHVFHHPDYKIVIRQLFNFVRTSRSLRGAAPFASHYN